MTQQRTARPRAAAEVAEAVLAERGLDFATAERGHGWTNASWLTTTHVIRVARRPGPADLLREVRLAALLPAAVGYPEVVDSGVLRGHEWVLSRRLHARNLEDAWPTLDAGRRASALRQVWGKIEHVHRLDAAAVAPYARPRSPFYPDSPAEAQETLRRLTAAGLLSERQLRVLRELLERFWAALPGAPTVLTHGDLGLCNVLWHEGRVVSVLDFECAALTPVEVDVYEVLKFAFAPLDVGDAASAAGPTDPDADASVRAAALDVARAALSRPGGGPDLLLGYAVLLEAWLTEHELAADPAAVPARLVPYHLLTRLAEGDGGHLAPVVAALGAGRWA